MQLKTKAKAMQEIYKFITEHNVIMSFRGDISHETVTSILSLVKKFFENNDISYQSKKKLYAIVVECTDNITRNKILFEQNLLPAKYASSIFCISEHPEYFNIQTGNYILNTRIPALKQKLKKVNLLDKKELKLFYQKKLLDTKPQGGGLGIIDISIRSGRKLSYEFIPYSTEISFFILQTLLNK